MFDWWNKRPSRKATAPEIYGAIVSRARQPAFFETFGVEDTPEGRYELIVLTMVLVLERLRQSDGDTLDLRRRVIEAFVTDMDDNMREMGVGDLTVPRKVKRAAAALMERLDQYRNAFATDGDDALAAALAANIPGVEMGRATDLARVLRADVRHLAGLSDALLNMGEITFTEDLFSSASNFRRPL